mgnify:FL=1
MENDTFDLEKYYEIQKNGSDWSYGSRWGDQMEQAVSDIFRNISPKKTNGVIDIGCGEGRGLQRLRDLGFKRLHGIDISEEKILYARKNRSMDILFDVFDFHKNLSLLGRFDIGFSSHALEHCYCFKTAINSICSIINRKFYFIVPIGETPEEVSKFNPSHTHPFKDLDHVHKCLIDAGVLSFSLQEKCERDGRMGREVWGCIFIQ